MVMPSKRLPIYKVIRILSSLLIFSLSGNLLGLPQAWGQSQAEKTIQSVRERLRKLQEESSKDSKQDSKKETKTGDNFHTEDSMVDDDPLPLPAPSMANASSIETEASAGGKVSAPTPHSPSLAPSLAPLAETVIAPPKEVPVKEVTLNATAKATENTTVKTATDPERESAYTMTATYKGEANRVFSGGLRQRTVFLGNLDLKLAIDGEKAWGKPGLSLFFYGLGNHGADNDNSPTKNVGDIQVTSNIETSVNALKLYEAWVQKEFAEGKGSLLFGLHDLNSEFYVTESSSLFLNSSFGVGKELAQTGINGPSIFPTTALALRGRWAMSPATEFQVAAFGAQAGDPIHPSATIIRTQPSDGLFWIGELALKNPLRMEESLDGKFALGFWKYTRSFDHLTETTLNDRGDTVASQAGNSGAYILWNQALSPRYSLFARFGQAATAVNTVSSNFSSGVLIKAPWNSLWNFPWNSAWNSRAKDSLGVAFTRANIGKTAQEAAAHAGFETAAAELTGEIFYRFSVRSGVWIQPDLQWVEHPSAFPRSANPPIANTLVGAVRAEIQF